MGTLSAPVMLRGLNVWQSDKRVTQTEDMVSVCFLLALLLGGSSRLSLFGLQVGMTFAAFLTVGAGFYLGSGAETLMGMLGGISLAAQGYPLDLAVGLGAGGFLERTDPQKGVRAAECLCLRRRVRNGAVAFRADSGGLDGALSVGGGGAGVVSAQGAYMASYHLSAYGSRTAAGGGSICRAAC